MSKITIRTEDRRRLRRAKAVTDFAHRLYEEILDRAWSSGTTWVSVSRLSEDMGERCRKAIARSIRLLIEHGIITREERSRDGGRITYFLHLTDPLDWTLPEGSKAPRESTVPMGSKAPRPWGPKPHGHGAQSPTAYRRTGKGEQEKGTDSPKGLPAKAGLAVWKLENAAELPEEWRADPDFAEAWGEWCQQRLKKKFALTPRALKIQTKLLLERSGGDLETAIKMLDKAANKGWGECFPLDPEEKPSHTASDFNPLIQS